MDLEFASLVDVTPTGPRCFVGICLAGAGDRVFGGQVAAQSLRAAAGDGELAPHSLHAHFLAPALTRWPVCYQLTELKRTPKFKVIRVDAYQRKRLIATSSVSFHTFETSSEHQEVAPAVPAPHLCEELQPRVVGGPSPAFAPIESLLIDSASGSGTGVPTLRLWQRCRSLVSEDAVLHACGVVWMSDLTMTRTVDLPHSAEPGRRVAASLDHAVWFHRPVRANDWLLSVQRSTSYAAARGWAGAQYFSPRGELVATIAQECLTRRAC